jgi:hypothetical protein
MFKINGSKTEAGGDGVSPQDVSSLANAAKNGGDGTGPRGADNK